VVTASSTSDPSLGNSPLTRHTTTEELLDTVFSITSAPELYNEVKCLCGGFAKPELTEDLYIVTSVIHTLDERPSIFIRDKPIFSSERMLHKDYYHKGSVEKVIGVPGLTLKRVLNMFQPPFNCCLFNTSFTYSCELNFSSNGR
jgi:hypothetical protein